MNYLARLAMFIWLFQFLGCSHVLDRLATFKEPRHPDPNLIALKIANQAFQKGDFRKALEGYKILQHAADEKIARKALYGLSCAHLSLAENPDDFREALILWHQWSELAPADLEDEDPRLLEPLLESKILLRLSEIGKTGTPKSDEKDEKEDYERFLRNKEKVIQDLKNKLKVMENELQTLRGKLESLEAIDRKIEEKKKEVSSP